MVNLLPRATMWKTGVRHFQRHPWQTWLTLVGITLAVAIVVAVDIANASARRAFSLSMELVTGRATHQVIGGPQGIPESVYSRLRSEPGIGNSSPIVSGLVRIAGRDFTLLGIDPLADNLFRPGTIKLSETEGLRFFLEPDTLMVSQRTADQLSLTVGSPIELTHRGTTRRAEIVGILEDGGDAASEGILLADIATAQEILGREGSLDRIDWVLDNGEQKKMLENRLPGSLSLVDTATRNRTTLHMTDAFHTNLAAMSLLALLVGGFLIFNTMTFSVLQRRSLIGTLRSLGVTRREVFTLVIIESLAFGIAATIAGLGLGVLVGQWLVQLITRSINDLYYVLQVTQFHISFLSLTKGACLGLAATLVSALLPAWEAAQSPPVNLKQRSSLELRQSKKLPWLFILGSLLSAGGWWYSGYPTASLFAGFTALAFIIVGISLMIPLLIKLLGLALQLSVSWINSTPVNLALRGIAADISRSGPAITALAIAVSATVGVGIMIGSFRFTLEQWLDQSLSGDVYVSVPGRMTERADEGLPPTLLKALSNHPDVASTWRSRTVKVNSEFGPVRLMAVSYSDYNQRGFNLKEGDPTRVIPAFRNGDGILISEPLSSHQSLQEGDRIRLDTERGPDNLKILGIFYDYTSSNGLIIMPRQLYNRLWTDRGVSSLGLYRQPHVPQQAFLAKVRNQVSQWSRQASSQKQLQVTSNSEIKATSLAIFDRTFTVTRVLRLLSIGVAFIGVLCALMAIQLERRAQFALLRAGGMTRSQVSFIILLQTGLMGLMAGLLALPLGWVISSVLIDVINVRAFGWSMQSLLPAGVLLEALALALSAALLAGLVPARAIARINVAQALRGE